MSKITKRILFITQLDIWSMSMSKSGIAMGNQSLYNTLLEYVNHGYSVHVLTSANRLNRSPDLKGITIHRHPLPGTWIPAKLRLIRSFFSKKSDNEKSRTPVVTTDLNYKQYRAMHKVIPFYLWMSFWTFLLMCRYRFQFLYGYEMFGTPVAWFWARLFGKPVISRFQGTLMSKYLNSPEKLLYNWTHWLPMKLPTDLLIMTDDGTQGDKVLKYLKVPEARWRFWQNGVNLSYIHNESSFQNDLRSEHGISFDTIMFSSASRLTYWKRVDRIIRALALIPKDRKVFLVIIGDGEQRSALEYMVADLGIAERVLFTGSLAHDSVIRWHKTADVLISTYDVSNIGNQMLEAQVLGKPYLTVNTGDTGKVIQHGLNGLLVEDPDDHVKLADSMVQLIDDNQLRTRLSEGALDYSRKNILSWKKRLEVEIKDVEQIITSYRREQ
jgi:glycosyltransferase involved in cell wall biosynthesis